MCVETVETSTAAEPYVLTLPAIAPSLNVWRKWHWTKQGREKEAFQELVWGLLNEKGNRCPRGFDEVEIHSVLMFKVNRRRDSDNFGAVLYKWFQDVLVQQKVIPDDTSDRCTSHPPKIIIGEKEQTTLMLQLRVREP